jgi:hypothetical protein
MTNQQLLYLAHRRALKRLGLSPGNLGWVVDHKNYLSKTSGGVLQTTRHGPRTYEHRLLDTGE